MGKFLPPKIESADRTGLTLDEGELVFDTDTVSPWVGDGSTAGGLEVLVVPSTGLPQSRVEDLVSDLAAKQPLDSDLTTIAGLTATTDNFIQSKAGAWASRTVAQVKTDLSLTGTNSGDETASTVGTLINASSAATPNDTDLVATAESSVLKKITWTNVKAFLKTYFDTIYAPKATFPVLIQLSCSDLITDITTGTSVGYFRAPFAFTLTAIRGSLLSAQTSGSIFTVDINKNGTSIVSTKLTIDNNENTSVTAATAVVISTSAIADDDIISIDVDQAGTGPKGLIITLIGTRSL